MQQTCILLNTVFETHDLSLYPFVFENCIAALHIVVHFHIYMLLKILVSKFVFLQEGKSFAELVTTDLTLHILGLTKARWPDASNLPDCVQKSLCISSTSRTMHALGSNHQRPPEVEVDMSPCLPI